MICLVLLIFVTFGDADVCIMTIIDKNNGNDLMKNLPLRIWAHTLAISLDHVTHRPSYNWPPDSVYEPVDLA